jgi:hypothetical protein
MAPRSLVPPSGSRGAFKMEDGLARLFGGPHAGALDDTGESLSSSRQTSPSTSPGSIRGAMRPLSWVPTDAEGDGDLSLLSLRVLVALGRHADRVSRVCWPSVGLLAQRCNTTRRTVQRSLRALQSLDYIKPVASPRLSRAYQVLSDPCQRLPRHMREEHMRWLGRLLVARQMPYPNPSELGLSVRPPAPSSRVPFVPGISRNVPPVPGTSATVPPVPGTSATVPPVPGTSGTLLRREVLPPATWGAATSDTLGSNPRQAAVALTVEQESQNKNKEHPASRSKMDHDMPSQSATTPKADGRSVSNAPELASEDGMSGWRKVLTPPDGARGRAEGPPKRGAT